MEGSWPTPRLWATWRIEYVRAASEDAEKGKCILCELPAEKEDEKNLILYRSQRAFAVLNRFPYNPGHVMVAPYRHVPSLEDLDEEEALEIWRLVKLSMAAIRRAMGPDGFNIGVNVGRAAGAGIEGHVHVHIVPRWTGDVNFMPVLANTKVVSESLARAYRELKESVDKTLAERD